MKLRKEVFFLIFFAAMQTGFAQAPLSDSIRNLISNEADDTNKVRSIIELSNQFNRESSYDSAVRYSEMALQLAQKLSYKKGMERAYIRNGVSQYNLGNYPKAIEVYL